MDILEPLHNQVLIKQTDTEEKMYGQIVLPDMGKEKPLTGIVLAVGPGIYDNNGKLIPMSVEIGDLVFFRSFGGVRVTWEGEEYIISANPDLLMKIKYAKKLNVNELLKDTEEHLTKQDKLSIKNGMDHFKEIN